MANIELVIKVPEEYYNAIKALPYRQCLADTLIIKSGTPLPKGHGGLVDYEELKSNAREYGAYAEVILSHIKPKTIIDADKESE